MLLSSCNLFSEVPTADLSTSSFYNVYNYSSENFLPDERSDQSTCPGTLQLRISSIEEVLYESPLVKQQNISQATSKFDYRTLTEQTTFEAWCFGVNNEELAYEKFEQRVNSKFIIVDLLDVKPDKITQSSNCIKPLQIRGDSEVLCLRVIN